MNLGDKIKDLRETLSLTQGQLAGESAVSQGYLSQLESGDVKNPSAAVLLRVAQAMQVNPDDLFEAAGYPTTRTLRQVYETTRPTWTQTSSVTWAACPETASDGSSSCWKAWRWRRLPTAHCLSPRRDRGLWPG